MLGRLDLAQYENGCKVLTNWWPKVTGGRRRRPGSVYLSTPANAVRVESFVFSETQVYVVVFCSDNNVLFYDQDTGALIYTLAITGITLDATVIPQLSITQKADVMFCAHENFPTLMIRRTAAAVFAQETYQFEVPAGGHSQSRAAPFVKYADIDTTVAVDDWVKGNPAIATSSPPAFETRHVGRIIRYRGKQMYVVSLIGGPLEPLATCNVTIL